MIEWRIVTVTLNPAIDRVLEAPQFKIGSHVRAHRIGWHPAGKGINVARVLGVLGTRCVATGLVGVGELATFEDYLRRVGHGRVTTQLLVVRGATRENITIMDPVLDTETHIRDEGFKVQREDVRRISSKIGMLAREHTIVAICGSIPPGVSLGDLRSILHRCNDQGARVIVDAGPDVLPALRDEPLWMVKLNPEELASLSDMPTESFEDNVAAARAISAAGSGSVEYVVATRGAEGAILVGRDVAISARAFVHPGRIANTVGCGDALLAGLLDRWRRTGDWRAALSHGVATATANAVSREPGVLHIEDVREFTDVTTVEELEPAESA